MEGIESVEPNTKSEIVKLITDFIIIILVLILIVVIIIALFTVKKDSLNCLQNPIEYFQNLKNISCYCGENIPIIITP